MIETKLQRTRRLACVEWARSTTIDRLAAADPASIATSYGVAPDVATIIIYEQRKIRRA